MTTVKLRPATWADNEFSYLLHRATVRVYVQMVWGWEETDQRAYHKRSFDPEHTQIVTIDGHDAGLLRVEYRPHDIYLARLEIHPDYQGRGIGSQLVQQLLDQAAARDQVVTLGGAPGQPSRPRPVPPLGFQDVPEHGRDDIKIKMQSTKDPLTRGAAIDHAGDHGSLLDPQPVRLAD